MSTVIASLSMPRNAGSLHNPAEPFRGAALSRSGATISPLARRGGDNNDAEALAADETQVNRSEPSLEASLSVVQIFSFALVSLSWCFKCRVQLHQAARSPTP